MPQDEHVGAADLFAHESVAQIAVDVEVVPVAFVAVPRRLDPLVALAQPDGFVGIALDGQGAGNPPFRRR